MSQSAIARLWERVVGSTESNTEQVGCGAPAAEEGAEEENDDSKSGGCGCC